MSRARNIKPGFFKNEALAECEPMARLMFVGLWTLADRNGNLENRPKRLKGELFPYDNCDPTALLAQLVAHGLVVEYEAGGMALLNIPAFKAHQNPHMAEKPKYPEPGVGTVPAPDQHGANPADSLLLNPESGILNPEGSGKPARGPDPLFESIAEACGFDWRNGLGKAARGELNAALVDLKAMNAQPDDVPSRAAAYRKRYPDCAITPSALAKWWPSLGAPPPSTRKTDPALAAAHAATMKREAERAARLAEEGKDAPRPDLGGIIGKLAASKRA